MPKLWNDTVQAHRREVREAILDTTATLVAEHGPLALTMSQIAERTGIGRATLYKYFADVEAILIAWHDRHVTAHLEHLVAVRERTGGSGARLEAVLAAYAQTVHGRARHDCGADLSLLLHQSERMGEAKRQLHDVFRDVLAQAAESGDIRDDIAVDELADYCLHALAAAGGLPDSDAVHRLVMLTLAGLRPQVTAS